MTVSFPLTVPQIFHGKGCPIISNVCTHIYALQSNHLQCLYAQLCTALQSSPVFVRTFMHCSPIISNVCMHNYALHSQMRQKGGPNQPVALMIVYLSSLYLSSYTPIISSVCTQSSPVFVCTIMHCSNGTPDSLIQVFRRSPAKFMNLLQQ